MDQLGLTCTEKDEAVSQIVTFLSSLVELTLECVISDPPLVMEVGQMGQRVEFNNLEHDPFDGFIKGKQECFVILPRVRRSDGELVTKSLVLHKDYDLSA